MTVRDRPSREWDRNVWNVTKDNEIRSKVSDPLQRVSARVNFIMQLRLTRLSNCWIAVFQDLKRMLEATSLLKKQYISVL